MPILIFLLLGIGLLAQPIVSPQPEELQGAVVSIDSNLVTVPNTLSVTLQHPVSYGNAIIAGCFTNSSDIRSRLADPAITDSAGNVYYRANSTNGDLLGSALKGLDTQLWVTTHRGKFDWANNTKLTVSCTNTFVNTDWMSFFVQEWSGMAAFDLLPSTVVTAYSAALVSSGAEWESSSTMTCPTVSQAKAYDLVLTLWNDASEFTTHDGSRFLPVVGGAVDYYVDGAQACIRKVQTSDTDTSEPSFGCRVTLSAKGVYTLNELGGLSAVRMLNDAGVVYTLQSSLESTLLHNVALNGTSAYPSLDPTYSFGPIICLPTRLASTRSLLLGGPPLRGVPVNRRP